MPVTVRGFPSTSVSRAATTPVLWITPLAALTVSVPSSVMVPTSGRATGLSLTGVTLNAKVFGTVSKAPLLSCTLKVNLP